MFNTLYHRLNTYSLDIQILNILTWNVPLWQNNVLDIVIEYSWFSNSANSMRPIRN
jgi:hypothetical protein